MFWSIVYISAVLLADYTAQWFIPLPFFGLLAVGTLIFGATFTARDYVHGLGRRYVYLMIAVTIMMASVLSALSDVPPRIIIASALAIGIAETADTEVYHKLIRRSWFVRVLSSNGVSVPIDTLVFNLVAFAWVFPAAMIVEIVYADILVKYLSGLVIAFFRSGKAEGQLPQPHVTKVTV